jgi:ADP-heptose:LPS heptosyltransferase
MRVDTMRRIDRWVGIPLAALMVGLYRLRWRLARPARPETVHRIAFIELSEMGSTIIADPAMRRARELFPGAELYFVIFAGNRGSLDILGTIEPARAITIREDSFIALTLDTVAALWRLRRLHIDLVIDLELFSRYTSLLSLLSGAPLRVGFHRFHNEGLYRGDHLTHPVQYNPHQHMAKNFLALVHAATEDVGVVPHTKRRFEDAEIRLAPYRNEAACARLHERLIAAFPVLGSAGKWAILNPNASELMLLRKWPLENFGQFAARLLKDPDLAVLITGAASEKADAQRIARMAPSERMIDLTGFTRLDELPALYSLSTMMLTNDSGPAHLAAPTGLKTWVLFGPETPTLYGALNPNAEFFFKGLACSPCVSASNHRKSPCTDNQCMKQITVEEVFARVRSYLDRLELLELERRGDRLRFPSDRQKHAVEG